MIEYNVSTVCGCAGQVDVHEEVTLDTFITYVQEDGELGDIMALDWRGKVSLLNLKECSSYD